MLSALEMIVSGFNGCYRNKLILILNMKIAKNNLAYPLLKDTFSVLGSSQCKDISVLGLKDAFYSLRLSDNSKRYCGILP